MTNTINLDWLRDPWNHKCDCCGKPATANKQLCMIEWSYDAEGNLQQDDVEFVGMDNVDNQFRCDDCDFCYYENKCNEHSNESEVKQ